MKKLSVMKRYAIATYIQCTYSSLAPSPSVIGNLLINMYLYMYIVKGDLTLLNNILRRLLVRCQH